MGAAHHHHSFDPEQILRGSRYLALGKVILVLIAAPS